MRYPASEKLEIIRLVEQSHLPVRRTGRCEVSTVRMISSLSEASYLMRYPPHPRSRFF